MGVDISVFWEVNILEVDILGVDILGVDILGVDILKLTPCYLSVFPSELSSVAGQVL